MKKIILCLVITSLGSFAYAEQASVKVRKSNDRAFEVMEVMSGETNIKKIYTVECSKKYGIAAISINEETNQGNLKLNGTNCVVLGVDRLANNEPRVIIEDGALPEEERVEINKPAVNIQFHNNVTK